MGPQSGGGAYTDFAKGADPRWVIGPPLDHITSMDAPGLMDRRVNPSGPPMENAARTARSSIRPGKPADEARRIPPPLVSGPDSEYNGSPESGAAFFKPVDGGTGTERWIQGGW